MKVACRADIPLLGPSASISVSRDKRPEGLEKFHLEHLKDQVSLTKSENNSIKSQDTAVTLNSKSLNDW